MGGRGRPNTSLTHEQMSAMGLISKELQAGPQTVITPPPVFPALMSKPVPLENNADRDYKILWKEDFISYLKDSPYFTHPISESDSKASRYSDKYTQVLTRKSKQSNRDFNWDHLPAELRPNWKRKAASASTISAKKTKAVNLEEKLKILEEKESATQQKHEDPVDAPKAASDDEENEEVEDEEHDDEMDEDNDYGNSYFDNGDAYNEEDDNLDDGPVY